MATTDLDIKGALIDSGHKFRKDILLMPVVGLGETRTHMTTRFDVRGKETVGEARSGARIRPYRTAKDATNTTSISPRTLETMLGDVVEEFDPVALYKTAYSENVGKERTKLDFVRAIAVEMARQATSELPNAIFTGVRNAAGNGTMDLFDGFDTITKAEKVAGNISVAKGNLVELGGITLANVGDKLKEADKACHSVLKKAARKMFVPVAVKELYDEWYLANFGPVAYNTKDQQSVLHMTNGLCEIVALPGMEDSTHIFISTKKNMLIGVDQTSDEEKVEINKCDNPKVVQFFMTLFFGVQFESISPEVLMTASFSLVGDPALASDPEAVACDNTVVNATSTKTVVISGENLTGNVDLAVQGAGFTLNAYTITKADAEAAGGKEITVTFAPLAAQAYAGKIVAVGGGASLTINLTGTGTAE